MCVNMGWPQTALLSMLFVSKKQGALNTLLHGETQEGEFWVK